MDLEKYNSQKYTGHWAEELEAGDRCKATIRHKTDGGKNRHNVELIVIENNNNTKQITAWDGENQITIDYNELTKIN